MPRYQLVFEERQAREIEALAREYGLTDREVLEQLVTVGLDQLGDDAGDPPERRRLRE